MTPTAFTTFITKNTQPQRPPLLPEISLHLAHELTPLWEALETSQLGKWSEPPYWAFAWPGSLALARFALDNPDLLQGRRVLDFACGCGASAIACALVHAASVVAVDIDPLAIAAAALNAHLNRVTIDVKCDDVVGKSGAWDIVLAGDVCYAAGMARTVLPWLRRLASTSIVLLADPGRAYKPRSGMTALASYEVETSVDVEGVTTRTTTVYMIDTD